MDLGEAGKNLIILIPIILLIIVNIFFRKRKGEKTPLGIAVTMLADVNRNQKLAETFSFHWRSSKFKTGSWKRNRGKLDFLPLELQETLSKAFGMAEEFNQRIEDAKKYKSDSYTAGINVDKLKEPLAKSRQQLEEWLRENMGNPEYQPKRRGLFG